MTDTFEGSCLCGAVAYRLTGDIQAFYYCECGQCRKTTGSVTAANLRIAPTPITWRRGGERVRLYRDATGRDFSRAFCIDCGSALPYPSRAGTSVVIPAGSLDTPPPAPVAHRQFVAERPRWAPLGQNLAAYDGFAPPQAETDR
ncbi:GFA family protein [uncultured Salinisphaera sp.]|uniref:GFA family protein n=1 Tax=uncultured Salinisphaera sp. TaxID=359372 RepID=UPI0032B29B9D|tara:strand:+ start:505 stop:936 length:432 start_codon:yes stop_codon:yes gene_type:complete